MKIQINKIYSYQHGGDARIICLDPIVSVDVQNGHIMRHQPDGKATEARCDLSEKEIPLKEYKLVIAMAGNESFDEGDVIAEVIEGQRLPDEKDCWKIITVREVRAAPEVKLIKTEVFPKVRDKLRFKIDKFKQANEKAGAVVTVREVDQRNDTLRTGGSPRNPWQVWTFRLSEWKDGLEMAE
mgnify:CR=1 FL=1